MKNLTPFILAIITSAIISLSVFFITLFLEWSFYSNINWYLPVLLMILTFVLSYYCIYFALEKFIYRKFKLIYKSIHRLKATKAEISSKMDLKKDMIEITEHEVEAWENNQRQEIEKLRELEKFRQEFLGNVSHELKTPIFITQGYIHTLLDKGIQDEKLTLHFLNKAAKSMDRLNAIVEDLSVISKLEHGDSMINYQPVDIFQLSKEVNESLILKAKERDIILKFKKGCEQSFHVNADKEKIRQVLINLLDNSIKYGKEKGETAIGLYDMADNILIEVADNGPGIEEKHLSRLFERFYRVDHSRSRDINGTGLGLSIVKHILEAHNQTINVRSKVGVGTTFGFTLQKVK